jgi:hypothetical protein
MKERIKPRPANAIKTDEVKVVDKDPVGEEEKKEPPNGEEYNGE